MIEVIVKNILFFAQKASPGYTLFLQPLGEETRSLPIVVGQYEAQAIALALEQVQMERPMTHDLLSNVIGSLTDGLESVVISEIRDGTFYAKLMVRDGDSLEAVDARPSDAIALALRTRAPIRVSKALFDEVAVPIPADSDEPTPSKTGSFNQNLNEITRHAELRFDLEKDLKEAVLREDYEAAARIRDRIEHLTARDA
jgi:hypothetical protein